MTVSISVDLAFRLHPIYRVIQEIIPPSLCRQGPKLRLVAILILHKFSIGSFDGFGTPCTWIRCYRRLLSRRIRRPSGRQPRLSTEGTVYRGGVRWKCSERSLKQAL